MRVRTGHGFTRFEFELLGGGQDRDAAPGALQLPRARLASRRRWNTIKRGVSPASPCRKTEWMQRGCNRPVDQSLGQASRLGAVQPVAVRGHALLELVQERHAARVSGALVSWDGGWSPARMSRECVTREIWNER
eukprot:628848-Rhodomonas_salina.2